MSTPVTFTSADSPAAFAAFSLDGDRQALVTVNNLASSGRPAGLTFRGSDLWTHLTTLHAIEARGMAGPRANGAGTIEAVVRSGELLDVAYTLGPNFAVTARGLITDLNVRVGQAGSQIVEVQMVFHPVDWVGYFFSTRRVGTV